MVIALMALGCAKMSQFGGYSLACVIFFQEAKHIGLMSSFCEPKGIDKVIDQDKENSSASGESIRGASGVQSVGPYDVVALWTSELRTAAGLWIGLPAPNSWWTTT